MKFKLDENLGTRTQQVFQASGFDVLTVRDQRLEGCADQQLTRLDQDRKPVAPRDHIRTKAPCQDWGK